MSIGKQTNPDGLELPAITICNETAYKNFEMNLDKESYLKNTLNLEDFFVNLTPEGTIKSKANGPLVKNTMKIRSL